MPEYAESGRRRHNIIYQEWHYPLASPRRKIMSNIGQNGERVVVGRFCNQRSSPAFFCSNEASDLGKSLSRRPWLYYQQLALR